MKTNTEKEKKSSSILCLTLFNTVQFNETILRQSLCAWLTDAKHQVVCHNPHFLETEQSNLDPSDFHSFHFVSSPSKRPSNRHGHRAGLNISSREFTFTNPFSEESTVEELHHWIFRFVPGIAIKRRGGERGFYIFTGSNKYYTKPDPPIIPKQK